MKCSGTPANWNTKANNPVNGGSSDFNFTFSIFSKVLNCLAKTVQNVGPPSPPDSILNPKILFEFVYVCVHSYFFFKKCIKIINKLKYLQIAICN